jgi:hypothetical protein
MRRAPILLAALLALVLSGCATGGDADAAALAERVIIGIGDDITPPYPTPRDADYLAAAAIASPRLPSDVVAEYDVEALSWRGNSGDDAGAQIEIRVAVHVPPASSTAMFGRSQPEGDATRCWRLTVFGYHDYDSLKLTEIACPPGPAPAPPTPAPLPTFPSDVEQQLTAALTGATDAETAVKTAFPDELYSILSASENGETAVALGIPAEFECVVGVIHADGTVQVFGGFGRVQLQPGETGCVPDLYFHPVITH